MNFCLKTQHKINFWQAFYAKNELLRTACNGVQQTAGFMNFSPFAKAQNDKGLFVMLSYSLLSYWAKRSIHKFEVQICAFKAWIFLLRLAPCKSLGRFVRKLKITKCAVIVLENAFCPSFRAVFTKTAWQSINLSKLYHKNSSKASKTQKIYPSHSPHPLFDKSLKKGAWRKIKFTLKKWHNKK